AGDGRARGPLGGALARPLPPPPRLPASPRGRAPKPAAAQPPAAIPVARQAPGGPPPRVAQPASPGDMNARLAGLRPNRANPAAPPQTEAVPREPAQLPTARPLTWDQRLGPIGLALVPILAGAAAWLVSSFIR